MILCRKIRRTKNDLWSFFNRTGAIEYFIAKAQEIEAAERSFTLEGHTENIKDLALRFGKAMNLQEDDMRDLKLATEIHDIGKLPIPENILCKPGKLTEEEFAFVKLHTIIGYLIVRFLRYRKLSKIILCHHERWDGAGYPLGLSGKDIPLLSRIMSIIDAYDAMTCPRVYKNYILTPKEALDEIKANSWSQFDPYLVKIFTAVWIEKHGDL